MANNCFYMMHIKGDKNAIDEFVGMMKDGKMGRFFSVEAEMDSDHEAIVSGDCAWSLSSAVLLTGTKRLEEPAFLNKMRRLGLSIEAYKTAQLLQSDGLDSAELDSLAAKIFMDMDGLQMCTDLAEQMAWECSTERTELAEVLWNGDPEQGIAALEDVAVDDDDCIKQEWMGYKPGTPRFAVWKDFETNFSKDGVSLYELSGFDDYRVEYKDPGPTLSESEFNKLFGSDVLDENVQKDVSDVNRDDPGSEDER